MKKGLKYLAILSFFLIVVFLGTFKIVNFDFGWHLKTGEYIYANRSIPKQDVFSYIAEGNKWVDSHWLFQVILYMFYALGAIPGVIFFRILILVLTFGFLFLTIYRKEYYPVSLWVCLLTLFISFQRFLMRPELMTFFFLAVFFYFTERFREYPRFSLLIIPLCQVMWVNTHGLHVLGVLFLLLYFLGDLLQMVLSQYCPVIPKIEINRTQWQQKGWLFGLTSIALFINANGKDGMLYPFKIFQELKTKNAVFSRITELVSPFAVKHVRFPDPSFIYKIFLVISLLAILCQLKRIRFAHILPYGAFLYLSVLAVRNMPLFAIIATPITILNIYGVLDFIQKRIKKSFLIWIPGSSWTGVIFIIFAVTICFFIANNSLYQRLNYLRTFGIGESNFYPAEAVDYLKNEDIPGNLFNSSDIGGYLIWKLYPEKQVSFDGRWEVYGPYLKMIQQLGNPYYFAHLAEKYDIQAIILHKRSLEIQLMGPWLRMSRSWFLTKNTREAIIYKKRTY